MAQLERDTERRTTKQLDPFGEEAEEEFNNDSTRPREVHCISKWKPHQDAVYRIHLARAQEKGLQFWQTRSLASILFHSVPAGCIEKGVCLQGDKFWHQRDSTPRLAQKMVLKDAWQWKQEQQGTLSSSGWHPAEEDPFEVDLRIQGIHKMQCSKVREAWPTFQNWWTSCELNTKQNLWLPTWVRKENWTVSVRNPKRQFEDRKIELFELRKVSKNTPCPSCSKYWLEGLLHCTCGVCLMPSQEQKRKIKSEFEILSIPYYIVKTGQLTRSKTWASGNMKIGKRKIQSEMRKRKDTIPSCQNGKMTKSIEITICRVDGRRIPSIPGYNCVCWHLIYRDVERELKDMRIILRVESLMGQSQDPTNIALVCPRAVRTLAAIKKWGKDEPAFPKTPTRDWNVNGKVGVGTSTAMVTVFFLFVDNLVAATGMGGAARTMRMARMARMARLSTASLSRHSTRWTSSKRERTISRFSAKHLHIRSLCFKEFRLQAIAIPL